MSQCRVALSLGLLLAAAAAMTAPETALKRLDDRIDQLLSKPQPKLFEWHLKSLRALAHTEFVKLALPVKERNEWNSTPPDRGKEFEDYLGVISTGLEGPAGDPDSYLKRGWKGLVLARPSNLDGTLQFMTVNLPKHWDPEKTYPLWVGLHGSGPDNPLAYPSFAVGPSDPPDQNASPGPTEGMISLAPWGRGNKAWHGEAEQDLWEALRLLGSFAKIDRSRCYLTGHSSGADGAWEIALHTPDLWAAVGLQSGSMLSGRPEWGLMSNVKNLPIYWLIGEKDNLAARIPDNKEGYRLMKKMGAATELAILPGVGHYPLSKEGLDAQARWMTGFVRTRPDKFTFIIDNSRHPGVWGINVKWQAWMLRLIQPPYPKIECAIKGQTVKIKLERIKEATIDLGPEGLGMSGEVTVFVNGVRIHQGAIPSKPLQWAATA